MLNKLDLLIKIKNFYSCFGTFKRERQAPLSERRYLQYTHQTKDLYLDYVGNSQKLVRKK